MPLLIDVQDLAKQKTHNIGRVSTKAPRNVIDDQFIKLYFPNYAKCKAKSYCFFVVRSNGIQTVNF